MSADALSDFAPSPWWPCPECGWCEFKVTAVFERGHWDDHERYEHYNPPSGKPGAVSVSDAECTTCGTVTNLHEHYRWGRADA